MTENDGSVVSFAIRSTDQAAYERTNDRHDFLVKQIERNEIELADFVGHHGRPALLQKHRDLSKGLKSPCVLRSLSHFDVGQSFLVDSLHNVYLGVFVSVSHPIL